jgi:hypothetical protein
MNRDEWEKTLIIIKHDRLKSNSSLEKLKNIEEPIGLKMDCDALLEKSPSKRESSNSELSMRLQRASKESQKLRASEGKRSGIYFLIHQIGESIQRDLRSGIATPMRN